MADLHMKRIGILLCLLLGGCGLVPTESKLLGSWQVDAPLPNALVYTFQKDHTYAMMVTGMAGEMGGTWRLDGNILVMTLKSFAAHGTTNTMPIVQGMNTQKNTIVKLTASAMSWRGVMLGEGPTFKRIPTTAPIGMSPL